MANELAKLGHEVHVYNNCPSPGMSGGVFYHFFAEYGNTSFMQSDAVVSLRNPKMFKGFTNALVRILWVHDAFNQQVVQPLEDPECRNSIDGFFFNSRWQAWSFVRCFGLPSDRVYVSRNGIVLDYFPDSRPLGERGKRMFYSSTPFRGLDLLVEYFPRIRRLVKDAELHVYSSMKVYQAKSEDEERQFGNLYRALDQPGIFNHGSLGQRELAGEISRCRLLAYPNTFHETSCITAMEAMAAGCPVVTSEQGALPETVGECGFLVPGIPGSPFYGQMFVNRCAEMLSDDVLWQEKSEKARKWTHGNYGWGQVASEWERKIGQMVMGAKGEVERLEGWHPKP
jgi:glycosyltransferase involved in cell wall biosynthesis